VDDSDRIKWHIVILWVLVALVASLVLMWLGIKSPN
jgi:hypothetical protein